MVDLDSASTSINRPFYSQLRRCEQVQGWVSEIES